MLYVTDTEWSVNGFRETFCSRLFSLSCHSPLTVISVLNEPASSLILVSSLQSSLTAIPSVPLLPGKLQVHQPPPPMANLLPLFIAISPSSTPPPPALFSLAPHFTCDQHPRSRQHAQQPFLEVSPPPLSSSLSFLLAMHDGVITIAVCCCAEITVAVFLWDQNSV